MINRCYSFESDIARTAFSLPVHHTKNQSVLPRSLQQGQSLPFYSVKDAIGAVSTTTSHEHVAIKTQQRVQSFARQKQYYASPIQLYAFAVRSLNQTEIILDGEKCQRRQRPKSDVIWTTKVSLHYIMQVRHTLMCRKMKYKNKADIWDISILTTMI